MIFGKKFMKMKELKNKGTDGS